MQYYCDIEKKGSMEERESQAYVDMTWCINRALSTGDIGKAKASFFFDIRKCESLTTVQNTNFLFFFIQAPKSITELEKVLKEFLIDTSWTSADIGRITSPAPKDASSLAFSPAAITAVFRTMNKQNDKGDKARQPRQLR